MPQTIDVFRSSAWGWLRGTLAGWGTELRILVDTARARRGVGAIDLAHETSGSPR